ncbi:MAG: uracil-DNA glycosylase [Planctomycetales bacterium]|nr:uracil-DNA glycosylase [Planctomycetales bacterium]
MPNQLPAFDLKRAIRQKLESLDRSGVMQLRHCDPVESSAPPVATQTESGSRQSPTVQPAALTDRLPTDVSPPSAATSAVSSPPTDVPPRKLDMSKRLSKKRKIEELEILNTQVHACTLCRELAATRTQTVFGVGNPNSRVVFFGEAPGADEDAQGEPFVGRAGKLLTKIIEACGFAREDVYIMNTLKCRPPGNRNPAPDEVTNCRPFYERQLEIIQPEFIVCLGSIAATNVLQTKLSIGKLRGELHDLNGIKVVATYHPAYLLRNPSAKKYVWDDMKMLLTAMGLPIPNAK